jgi:hypothetical protein
MSIWCSHWLLVRDLSWVATKAHAEAIHQALLHWDVVAAKPRLAEVVAGKERVLKGSQVVAAGEVPADLVMRYEPGEDEDDDEGWSTRGGWTEGTKPSAEVVVSLGQDWKLLLHDYGRDLARVTTPPLQAGKPASPFPRYPDDIADEAYASGGTPPRVEWQATSAATGLPLKKQPPYCGCFRSGVKLTWGALPDFVLEPSYAMLLPNRPFVKDLERAFGTPLVEITVCT